MDFVENNNNYYYIIKEVISPADQLYPVVDDYSLRRTVWKKNKIFNLCSNKISKGK